jgi:hypothetical protein
VYRRVLYTERMKPRRAKLDEPAGGWSPEFKALLASWKDDIPRPPQTPLRKVRNPFD